MTEQLIKDVAEDYFLS